VKPAFLAIAAFRWDITCASPRCWPGRRGGLGMALDTALSNLYWIGRLVLLVIFLVVIVTEIVTSWVRARVI